MDFSYRNSVRYGIVVVLSISSFLAVAGNVWNLTAQEQAHIYLIMIKSLLGPDKNLEGRAPPVIYGEVYIDEMLFLPHSAADIKEIVAFDEKLLSGDRSKPPPALPILHGYPGSIKPRPTKMATETKSLLTRIMMIHRYKFHWISDVTKSLKFDKETGAIVGGGTWVTLSKISFLSDNQVYAEGRINKSIGESWQRYYFFQRDISGWHLVKTVPEVPLVAN